MQRLSYRPGPIRSPVLLELGADGIRHGGGALRGWGSLRSLQYGTWSARGMRGVNLILEFEEGREVIAVNHARGDRQTPQVIRAVLAEIARARPGMPVRIGMGADFAWAMWATGLASVVFALGVLVLALASGVSAGRMIQAILPIGLLLVFGVVLLSGGKPWQARPPVEIEQLLADP